MPHRPCFADDPRSAGLRLLDLFLSGNYRRTFIKNAPAARTALWVMLAAPFTVQASFASECSGLRPDAKIAWETALKQSDVGHAQWATGDASAIKKMWADTDDVTIFGGLGAYERGWSQVAA